MAKINHSKFKNSGLLFELLTRQITSDILSNKSTKALDILKKYYNNTELSKEYKLYKTFFDSKVLNENKSESLISSLVELSKRVKKSETSKLKYELVKEIKKNYNLDDFFKSKVSNYKELASLYVLFESANSEEFIEPTQIIESKHTLLEYLTKKNVDKDEVKDKILEEFAKNDKDIRLLAYRILLEKFNSKYSSLSSPQKLVLREYINNISNTNNLKEFINSKYVELKKSIKESINKVDDKVTKIKLIEVVKMIKPITEKQKVKDEYVLNLLQYYSLVDELNSL